MTDKAYAVPLHELLASVPREARLVIDDDGMGTRFIPVGRYCNEAAEALRARLMRIKCIVKDCQNHRHEGKFVGDLCSPCHTFITTGEGKYSQAYRNSQREWQGLTDEEYTTIMQQADHDAAKTGSVFQNLRYAIEAKLKEKNGY